MFYINNTHSSYILYKDYSRYISIYHAKNNSTQLPLLTWDQVLESAAAYTTNNQHNTGTNMPSGIWNLDPSNQEAAESTGRLSSIKWIQIYSISYQCPCTQCCWADAVSVYQTVRWGCTYCIYWKSLP